MEKKSKHIVTLVKSFTHAKTNYCIVKGDDNPL